MTAVKIYLAARYDHRAAMVEFAKEVEKLGFKVTSRWLSGQHVLAEGLTDETDAEASHKAQEWMASEDFEDVMEADIVIFFAEPKDSTSRRGGRHVEMGIALGALKAVIRVGTHFENTFQHLPCITNVENQEQALAYLQLVSQAYDEVYSTVKRHADLIGGLLPTG